MSEATETINRSDLERLVAMADRRWRSHTDGWAQDFARYVPALLAEIDRLGSEATSRAAEERQRCITAVTEEKDRLRRRGFEDDLDKARVIGLMDAINVLRGAS